MSKSQKKERSTEYIAVIVLFIIGLIVRVTHAHSLITSPDSVLYLSQVKAFLSGSVAFTFMAGEPKVLQPMFPLLTILFSYIFPTIEVAATFVSVIFGSLVIIPVYLLSKNIFGWKAALIASFLVTFDPLLINYSIVPLTEALFTFLLIAVLMLCWYQAFYRYSLIPIITGLVLGFAYLTRVIGITLVLLTLIWIVLLKIRAKEPGNAAISAGFVIAGFLIPAIPYWILLYNTFHKWSISGFYGGTLKNISNLSHPLLNVDEGTGIVAGIFQKYFLSMSIYLFMFITTISVLALLFVIISLFKRWDRDELIKSGYLFSWIFFFFFISVLFPPSGGDGFVRYLMPIVPVLYILTAHGAVIIVHYIQKRFNMPDKSYGYIVILLLLSFSFIPEYYKAQRLSLHFRWFAQETQPPVYQNIGERIKAVLPSSPNIISRKPFVPFYADAVWYPISSETTYNDLLKVINAGGDFIYTDVSVIRSTPNIVFLLDPDTIPDGLTPVYWEKFGDTGKYKVVLYRVNKG